MKKDGTCTKYLEEISPITEEPIGGGSKIGNFIKVFLLTCIF